jgi:hypothetical protein
MLAVVACRQLLGWHVCLVQRCGTWVTFEVPSALVSTVGAAGCADALGGNSFTLIIGTLRQGDYHQSSTTMRQLAHAKSATTLPVINHSRSRGLLHKHRFKLHRVLVSLGEGEGGVR